jgi:hypothetical protein
MFVKYKHSSDNLLLPSGGVRCADQKIHQYADGLRIYLIYCGDVTKCVNGFVNDLFAGRNVEKTLTESQRDGRRGLASL